MPRKKIYRLSETELTNLLRFMIFEQSEQPVGPIEDCLKTTFQISDSSNMKFCPKLLDTNVTKEDMLKCGDEICTAKGETCGETEKLENLEKFIDCLDKKKTIAEQTDDYQTKRENSILEILCSVKNGVITKGNYKNKKWEDYVCDVDLQLNELNKFMSGCTSGEVTKYFENLTPPATIETELKTIKTKQPPKGKSVQELGSETLKGIIQYLKGKTAKFLGEDDTSNFIGLIKNIQQRQPGVLEFEINKYDTKTKKILDWGYDYNNPSNTEGSYVTNPKKSRIFKYVCCEFEDTDDCEYFTPSDNSDSNGFLPHEKKFYNSAILKVIQPYCDYYEKEKEIEVKPDFSKGIMKNIPLTEETQPTKIRLFGPRSDSFKNSLSSQLCGSDGKTVGDRSIEDFTKNWNVGSHEIYELLTNCPDSVLAKKPGLKLPPYSQDNERIEWLAYTWCAKMWNQEKNDFVGTNVNDTYQGEIDYYGWTEDEIKKVIPKCPNSPLSRYYKGEISVEEMDTKLKSLESKITELTELNKKLQEQIANNQTKESEETKVKIKKLENEVVEDLGANILVGKTVGFYGEKRRKKIGNGRIEKVSVLETQIETEGDNTETKKIWKYLLIVVTNIDDNLNDLPKGRNLTNKKTLIYNCDDNVIRIAKDENNRSYPANQRPVYTNSGLVNALKQGYCSKVKQYRLDYK